MAEYRPLPDDRRDVFYEYVSYAFSPGDGPPEYDPDEHDTPRANLGERRGLYEDGASTDADPLCVCGNFWFDVRVRGERRPAAGLSAVVSPPENRRGGHVVRMLEGALAEYRERGAHLSVLWPFRYRFYRRYGWDAGDRRVRYECDPGVLSFAADALDGDGSFRRVDADDHEALDDVYETHAAGYDLALVRDADWWRHRILTGWETDPFVYAWERDGDVRGYLVYRIDGDRDDRTMRVRELAFVDREAYLALLSFCHNHDSQVSTVSLPGPADARLLDLAADPDEIDCGLRTGPMVRLVDVVAALSALSYPAVDASVTLAVADPLVDWNDATVSLDVDGGAASAARSDADPDARIDVGALSQMAVGYRSAADLSHAGRLDAPESVVSALGRLFPETPTYLREHF